MFVCIGFVIAAYAVLTLFEFWYNPAEFEDVNLHADWSGFGILLVITVLLLPIHQSRLKPNHKTALDRFCFNQ